MPIYFYWNGLLWKASAHLQPSPFTVWVVQFNGRERRLMMVESGWAELPYEGQKDLQIELKNRIGHSILFYQNLNKK